ncbi:hypothetical protein FXO38_06460 [Capsicum annuum]|nr:hypothetical protein FXO38_06460 [Capsicum annuum]KAF3674184.1 hypothetical protein FXO37_06525 [Capsicum annuum]
MDSMIDLIKELVDPTVEVPDSFYKAKRLVSKLGLSSMTAGKLACPYCMKKIKSFTFRHGRKNSWFDCHSCFLPPDQEFRRPRNAFIKNRTEYDGPPPSLSGYDIWEIVQDFPKVSKEPLYRLEGYDILHNWTKQSIFWELKYWPNNLLRHNIDIMHTEKNYFDTLFNTVMDVSGKTNDSPKARLDLPKYYKRRELHLQEGPNGNVFKRKPSFTFNLDQKRQIWFFDVMEHLPIHHVHEARLGGLVQTRWMYPFECDQSNWWAIIKTKPIERVKSENMLEIAYQNEMQIHHQLVDIDLVDSLNHSENIFEEVNITEEEAEWEGDEKTFEEGEWSSQHSVPAPTHVGPLHGSTTTHSSPIPMPPLSQDYQTIAGTSSHRPSSAVPSSSSHPRSHSDFTGSIGLMDLHLGGTPSGLGRMLELEKLQLIVFVGTSIAIGPVGKRTNRVRLGFILKPIWQEYLCYWNSEEYQLLSDKGKKVRASSKGGSLYTAGVVSMIVVEEKMDKYMQLVNEYRSTQPPESRGDTIPEHVEEELWQEIMGPTVRRILPPCIGNAVRATKGLGPLDDIESDEESDPVCAVEDAEDEDDDDE